MARPDLWLLDRFSQSWENTAIRNEISRRGYQAEIVDWAELTPLGGDTGMLRGGSPAEPPRLAIVKSRVFTRCPSGDLALIYDGLEAIADAGTRVLNSPQAIRRSRNKLRQAEVLARAGLPVPPTRGVRTEAEIDKCMADWGEIVLKPVWGHASVDVTRMRPHGRLAEPGTLLGIREEIVAWHLLERYHLLCAQAFIENPGRDLRVTVIGSVIASCIYHVSTAPDGSVRHFLYPLRVEQAPLTPEIVGIAHTAVEALELDFAIIDMVESPAGPVIIEVNQGLSVWRDLENTGYDLTPGGYTSLVTDQLEEILASMTASSSGPAPNRTGSAVGSPVSSATRASSA